MRKKKIKTEHGFHDFECKCPTDTYIFIMLTHFTLNLSKVFNIALHAGLSLYAFFLTEDIYSSLMEKKTHKKTQKQNQTKENTNQQTHPKHSLIYSNLCFVLKLFQVATPVAVFRDLSWFTEFLWRNPDSFDLLICVKCTISPSLNRRKNWINS